VGSDTGLAVGVDERRAPELYGTYGVVLRVLGDDDRYVELLLEERELEDREELDERELDELER